MKELFKAIANFQQSAPIIHKGTSGYGYSYADLPTILETINPILKANNLGFTQLGQGKSIKTIIFHTETGESLESVFDIPEGTELKGQNDFQVLGSAITYIRRYALSSALGIVTDKDTDANVKPQAQAKPKAHPKPKQQPKPQPKSNAGNDALRKQIIDAIKIGTKEQKELVGKYLQSSVWTREERHAFVKELNGSTTPEFTSDCIDEIKKQLDERKKKQS